MIKVPLLCFLSAICWVKAISQEERNTDNNIRDNNGNTYAVVVGIANYENDLINLQYANRDAVAFAGYLTSQAGGAVPPENIKLLIDTNATTAAIYNSLSWLRDRCEKDKNENPGRTSTAYFYFSGHGDLEAETRFNMGFLLAFNTPQNNYLNNAVRLEDLNLYANTLSVDMNAKVIIITDACHSGKLAGSNNGGTYLVGKELMNARAKEIRIASCKPDELSNEDARWGGGRGVFSYYLVNGLKGLADKNNDHIITLDEIRNYVDSSIAEDPFIIENKMKQTPVLQGNAGSKIATINPEALISFRDSVNASKPILSDQDYFFGELKKNSRNDPLDNKNLLDQFDYAKLNMLPVAEIPSAFIEQAQAILDSTADLNRIKQLEILLRNDQDQLKQFKQALVDVLHTRGQKIINLYLDGDAAELERREYYNSQSSGYDVYPAMYDLAIKLTETNNPLLQILEVNRLYFKGVAARIKIPMVELAEQKKLIDSALRAQQKALALSNQAAYIHNEIGVLFDLQGKFPEAEKYFTNATILAPDWAVPWANLAGLFASTRSFEKGIEATNKAIELSPNLVCIYVNSGYLNENKKNLLVAEELYRKSIRLNSRHYSPFERLGFVYMNTSGYALADSFFMESEERKKGYHFIPGFGRGSRDLILTKLDFNPPEICPVNASDVGPDDVLGHLALGLLASESYQWMEQDGPHIIDRRSFIAPENMESAEREFRKVIALDKTNPLACHYLGKLLASEQRWQEAELILNLALNYHLDDVAFDHYLDSIKQLLPGTAARSCILSTLKAFNSPLVGDHYLLGSFYQDWHHYTEAEMHYRKIKAMDSLSISGYYMLWSLLESIGRYKDAEEVIRSFMANGQDKKTGESELYGFYKRMVDRFPDDGDWNYKTGLFLYHLAAENPQDYPDDKKMIVPDTQEEVFASEPNSRFRMFRLPGSYDYRRYAQEVHFPRNEGIKYLMKADSLLKFDEEALADINDKIGDLYTWQGLEEKAIPHYQKSVDLYPQNSGVRLKLVDVENNSYHFTGALAQMDSLLKRKEINFPKMLLMAKYLVLAGNFSRAQQLLDSAEKISPSKIPEITELNGRLQLMAGYEKEALVFYNRLKLTTGLDKDLAYTIARLYSKLGNIKEAWRWLETAAKEGFNYSYVLNYDSYLYNLHKTPRWKLFIRNFKQPGKFKTNAKGGY